jgi:hypothetical protein
MSAPDRWAQANPPCRPKIRRGCCFLVIGAGEGIRTLDPDLGKVVLYP